MGRRESINRKAGHSERTEGMLKICFFMFTPTHHNISLVYTMGTLPNGLIDALSPLCMPVFKIHLREFFHFLKSRTFCSIPTSFSSFWMYSYSLSRGFSPWSFTKRRNVYLYTLFKRHKSRFSGWYLHRIQWILFCAFSERVNMNLLNVVAETILRPL